MKKTQFRSRRYNKNKPNRPYGTNKNARVISLDLDRSLPPSLFRRAGLLPTASTFLRPVSAKSSFGTDLFTKLTYRAGGFLLSKLVSRKGTKARAAHRSRSVARFRAVPAYTTTHRSTRRITRRVLLRRFQPTASKTVGVPKVSKRFRTLRRQIRYHPVRRRLVKARQFRLKGRLSIRALRSRTFMRSAGAQPTPQLDKKGPHFRYQRYRWSGLPRAGLRSVVLQSKVLIRKLRATRGVKHVSLKRRIFRLKWRNRKKFTKLSYKRRRRMVYRLARRGNRHFLTARVLLRSTKYKYRARRLVSRARRLQAQERKSVLHRLFKEVAPQLKANTSLYIAAQRHRLLNRLHRSKKTRAEKLLSSKARFISSLSRVKSRRSWLQKRRAALRLRRRLALRRRADTYLYAGQTKVLSAAYRSSALIRRRSALLTKSWIRLRHRRVRRNESLTRRYLITDHSDLRARATSRQIRRLAYQRFPLLKNIESEAPSKVKNPLYPQQLSTRYRSLTLRLQRRKAMSTPANRGVEPSLNSSSLATFFKRDDYTSYWRQIKSRVPANRFTVSSTDRNRTLRARSIAFAHRQRTHAGHFLPTAVSHAITGRGTVSALRWAQLQLPTKKAARLKNKKVKTQLFSELTGGAYKLPYSAVLDVLNVENKEKSLALLRSSVGGTRFKKRGRELLSMAPRHLNSTPIRLSEEESLFFPHRAPLKVTNKADKLLSYRGAVLSNLDLWDNRPSFVQNSAKLPAIKLRQTAARSATIALRAERGRLIETRFYRKQAKLRLPYVATRRRAVRRSSARLFARHSLKKPQTLEGRRKLLLPTAKDAWTLTKNYAGTPSKRTLSDLRLPHQLKDDYPRVWTRSPRYRELVTIYDMREKKKTAATRRRLDANKRRASRIERPLTAKATRALRRINRLILKASPMTAKTFSRRYRKNVTAPLSEAKGETMKHLFLSKLIRYRERLLSQAEYTQGRRPEHMASTSTPLLSNRLTLRTTRVSNPVKKHKALWHLRSVQQMLKAERELSAWAPQYPTRWRRWSSPRREGSPMRRHWPSRKTLRYRAMMDRTLTHRGLPKRKHFDRSYGHLQYYRGSAATVGYERFRRIHRVRSKSNRWWKSISYPVPFTHPYSRRSVNAKKHFVKRLARKQAAGRSEMGLDMQKYRGSYLVVAQPPRLFPSRNYKIPRRKWEEYRDYLIRERKERVKLPLNLQRWMPRPKSYTLGRAAAPRRAATLRRTRRSIRTLEKQFPRRNLWAGHRWETLDPKRSTVSAINLFIEATRKMPTGFWGTLYKKAGTPARALMLRKALFARFCKWCSLSPSAAAYGMVKIGLQREAAVRYITTASDELLNTTATTALTTFKSAQYRALEGSQYVRLAAQKQDRFWRLRELPRLRKAAKGVSMAVRDRNNSILYKRWLHGAERYLKRGRISHLPPSHRRAGTGRMVDYGRSRRRFPASGRRRQSYDSMLHAFAKRTSPSRFRRLSTLRFQQIHPRVRRDYKVNLRTHELTGALRRRRLLAHKLSRVAYLTPTWRELLAYRVESPIVLPTVDFTSTEVTAPRTSLASATNTAVAYPEQYGQPFGATTKRRFAALPLNRLFKRAQTVQRTLRPKNLISLRTQRIGLLRTALRRRRIERAYLDLKKHTWRRRLPKEQLPPPWKNRKRARKHEEHMRYGDWSPRHFAFSQSKAIFWTLDALEDRVPRRRDRAPTAIQRSYHNEILTLPPATIKRANWARKGFRIKSVGKKAKRLRRSEKRRHRRARGKISKERRARFHHWSERKNFNQIRTVGKFGGTAFFRKVRIAVKKPNRGWRRRLLQTHKRIRSPLTSTSRHARMHSVNRRAVSDVIGSVNASGPTSLSSAVLPSFSSIVRPKRVNILKRRTAYRRNKFLRRQFAAIQRATRRNAAQPSALVSARVQAERALRRFTENLTNVSILTPLAFQRPTRLVVKTDAEKKRAVFWNIQSKERRYKRTAQYAESLAHYIPALISHMIAQRIKNRNLTYKRAKTLIHATYWNLRVYLNVDPFEKRLALRDNNFGLLRRLAKEVAVLAKEQLTEHADRTRLRRRFQPKRVHPAPTSDRFRLDWLRAFFPRKHALFQEDPEEYRVIPVSTRNIRHSIPTAQGIEVSRTAPKFPNLERRARRLQRLRLSRRDSRLETVLQTTRRVPLTEVDTLLPPVVEETAEMKKEAEALAAMQLAAAEAAASVYVRSKKFVFVKKGRNLKPAADPFEVAGLSYLFNEGAPADMGLSAHRTSFFQRGFSTATNRVAGSLARYISRHNRLLILSNQRIPTFTAVSARYRLKGRTEARGRSHFTASARWMIDTGSMDPRFLRYKSPRSRQYIVRLPSYLARKSDAEKTIKFLSYRKIRENLEAIAPSVNNGADGEQLARVNRRHFYNEFVPTLTPVIDAALAATRAIVLPRRWPTVLHARADLLRYEIGQTENYNFPNRQQLTFVPFSFHQQAHALQANEAIAPILDLDAHQLAPYTRKTYGARRVVTRARSVLQYRTASQRSIDRVYRAERVLHRQAISLKAASFTRGSMGRRAFRFLDSVANGALFQRRLLRFSVPTRRDRYKRNVALAARAVRVARSKVRVLRRNYRRIFQVRGRAQTQYSRLRNNAGAKFATSFHSRRLGAAIVGKLAPTARRFRITAYKRLALGRRLRKRCARLLRIRRRAIFDTSRPRLWHEVTHRWMKKHRFMREWLKNVKHWFRDPWLSQTVDVRTPSLGNLPPGVIRAREQQDGEVVDGDENIGFTKEEARAREKAALPAIALAKEVVVADKRRALAATKGATAEQKLLIIARKMLSKPALLKPRPTMWLANLQARELMAENTLRWTKTRKEKDEVRLAEKNAAIERAKNKLPRLPPKKDPLKVPANSFMPPVVWKEIQRRARQLEWRESDDVFRRSGFRMAFRFYPSERNRAPWLESLMYNRSLFSTRLHEFRRRQYPREQKKYKWLQRVRKSLFPGRTNVYIKGRRWPRIRMYNQRLHYTLFNLPNRSAARRHFKKLNRRSRKVGFVHAQEGLSNRLDNVLIHLNIVPTIFWARVVAPHGLLRVNGVIVKDMNYRFKAGDFIEPVWERICRFRHYFKTPLNRNEESKRPKRFSVTGVPRNFRYYPSLRCYSYLGNPREGDLRRSSRLQPHLFRWFKLDSV